MYRRWVKKAVSNRLWESYYSNHPGYFFLRQENGEVVMAFGIVENDIKSELVSLTDEELRQIDLACRATNSRPFPLEKPEDSLGG